MALAASARALARAGRRAEALAELAKLHDELEASGLAEAISRAFANVAAEVGEGDQALAAARQLAAKYPENPEFARIIARQSFQRHDLVTAVQAIDRAIQLSEKRPDPRQHALLLRLRALILLSADPKKSLESGLAAYLIDGNRGELLQFFQRDTRTFSPAFLEVSFDHLQVPESGRRDIRRVLAEAQSPSGDVMENLAAHLERMVSRINAAGSQAVLLSYPFPSAANGVARRVANDLGAGWIDVETDFSNRLNTARQEDLFVADGHLNDSGYAIVAELVSSDVKHRLLGLAPRP